MSADPQYDALVNQHPTIAAFLHRQLGDVFTWYAAAQCLAAQLELERPKIESQPALYEACRAFVQKVDEGRAHSRQSYAQMKSALAEADRLAPTPGTADTSKG